MTIDGEFGPATRAAAQCFHAAYGLEADGIAGPLTFGKIYELQKGDCSPVNFDWSELNQCGTDWSRGQVDAGTVQANVLVTMWKLQALWHAMGDRPIGINDGSATTPARRRRRLPRHPPHVRPRRRHERRLPGLLCPGP